VLEIPTTRGRGKHFEDCECWQLRDIRGAAKEEATVLAVGGIRKILYTTNNIGVAVLFFSFCTFSLSGVMKLTPVAWHYGEVVGILALVSEVGGRIS
jgi:hypothetical protein